MRKANRIRWLADRPRVPRARHERRQHHLIHLCVVVDIVIGKVDRSFALPWIQLSHCNLSMASSHVAGKSYSLNFVPTLSLFVFVFVSGKNNMHNALFRSIRACSLWELPIRIKVCSIYVVVMALDSVLAVS